MASAACAALHRLRLAGLGTAWSRSLVEASVHLQILDPFKISARWCGGNGLGETGFGLGGRALRRRSCQSRPFPGPRDTVAKVHAVLFDLSRALSGDGGFQSRAESVPTTCSARSIGRNSARTTRTWRGAASARRQFGFVRLAGTRPAARPATRAAEGTEPELHGDSLHTTKTLVRELSDMDEAYLPTEPLPPGSDLRLWTGFEFLATSLKKV